MNNNIIMSSNAMFISPLYNIQCHYWTAFQLYSAAQTTSMYFEYIATNKMVAKIEDLLK